jgi:predicted anti-sigma-YlaC factor YlaD
MHCDRFREAASARVDGDDAGSPDGALEVHLEVGADCRTWQQQAHQDSVEAVA